MSRAVPAAPGRFSIVVGNRTLILEQKQGEAVKFKSLPITSLEDATIDFEQLQVLLTTWLQSNGKSIFPQLPASAKKVYQDTTVTGLTWPGGTPQTSFTFTHGLATPSAAAYWAQHLDTSGSSTAFTKIQSATTSGCVIVSSDPFGSPPAATGYGLYILAVLTY